MLVICDQYRIDILTTMRDEDKMLEKWVGESTWTVFDMVAIVCGGEAVASVAEGVWSGGMPMSKCSVWVWWGKRRHVSDEVNRIAGTAPPSNKPLLSPTTDSRASSQKQRQLAAA